MGAGLLSCTLSVHHCGLPSTQWPQEVCRQALALFALPILQVVKVRLGAWRKLAWLLRTEAEFGPHRLNEPRLGVLGLRV